jgi:hypothetical protein
VQVAGGLLQIASSQIAVDLTPCDVRHAAYHMSGAQSLGSTSVIAHVIIRTGAIARMLDRYPLREWATLYH